jgi:hypothetical protein
MFCLAALCRHRVEPMGYATAGQYKSALTPIEAITIHDTATNTDPTMHNKRKHPINNRLNKASTSATKRKLRGATVQSHSHL